MSEALQGSISEKRVNETIGNMLRKAEDGTRG